MSPSALRLSSRTLITLVALVLVVCSLVGICYSKDPYELVWTDEFSGDSHVPPDGSKWNYDVGDGSPSNPGWGNRELQRYSTSTDNVFLDGKGHLVIRARAGANGTYTSGRIKTQGKFSFMYGKLEARIKIPYAMGIWPAFWMLGEAFPGVAWPESGEVDVMENFGSARDDGTINHGTAHGPGYSGDRGLTATYSTPNRVSFSEGFHVFSLEWMENSLKWFVDGNLYHTITPLMLPTGTRWVFNEPFFILLNVAVGGAPAPVGYPDSTTAFPQDMVVDYVRVYQRKQRR